MPTVTFGGGGKMVWGCFSWCGLVPLVPVTGNPLFPVNGNLNTTAYILDNFVTTVWGRPFPVSA
jgi:hypothetical protein